MTTVRTFIAVPTPPSIRHQVCRLAALLGRGVEGIRWVAEENLHWTLQFLGDVATPDLTPLCRQVEQAVASLAGFHIEVTGVGAFPTCHRPRTLWLGIADGQEQMVALQQTIAAALDALGFRREHRPFTPHLTFGRVRGNPHQVEPLIGRLADHADFAAGSMHVGEVVVFGSELSPGGPTYHVLTKVPLAPS